MVPDLFSLLSPFRLLRNTRNQTLSHGGENTINLLNQRFSHILLNEILDTETE